MLMRAMEIALDTPEQDQCLRVKQVLLRDSVRVQVALESWLADTGLTRPRYLSKILNMGTEPNGLFMWLIAQCLGMHLNLIHANGIWSTRHSGVPDLQDPAIVFVIGHYLAAPAIQMHKEEDTVKTAGKTLDESLMNRFDTPADVLE